MLFVTSLVLLLVLGVVLLALFLFGAFRTIGRFRAAQKQVTGHFADRTGLLKARTAALRVAISQRRRGATG